MKTINNFIIEKLKVSINDIDNSITFEDIVDALAVYCEKHSNYDVGELFEYDGIPMPKVTIPEFKHNLGYMHRISYIELEGNELISATFLHSRTSTFVRTLIRNLKDLVYCLGGDDKALGYEMLDKLYLDLTETIHNFTK